MKESIPPILRPDHVVPVELAEFAERFNLTAIGSLNGVRLTGISMNTGDLRQGDLFVAMPGKKTHGAYFVPKAIELGAVAIVTDRAGSEIIGECALPILLQENPRAHLGDLAAFVYGNVPGNMPKLFATTGTNGKTSTSYLLEGILRQLGETTGLTSTAERHIAGEVIVSRLTTPESPEMQALIARMREKGVTSVAVEVSAQALSQLRVDGLHFDVVGFTNLSHDHLDDYADMQAYLEAKLPLFTKARAGRGVVCLDSKYGKAFVKQSEIPGVTITSQMGVDADWHVGITAETPAYTSFVLAGPEGVNIRSRVPLLGAHMAANAGLAIVMLIEAGFDADRIQAAIANGIDAYLPGRTERVTGETLSLIHI